MGVVHFVPGYGLCKNENVRFTFGMSEGLQKISWKISDCLDVRQ